MGRPVNKRNFGKGTGNQLKTKFKVGGTEYDGYIVSQRATRRFVVKSMNDAVTATCTLVDKNPTELANGDMVVVVRLDDTTVGRATKIFNRTAIVNGSKVKWNFSTSTTDGAGQIADADEDGLTPVISIDTQPQSASVTAPATATFTVVATSDPVTPLKYQWQRQAGGTGNFTNISGATSASYTTPATTVEDNNGDKYRVRVSAAGAVTKTSAEVTLTVA